MITERELSEMEREFYRHVCCVSETGGVALSTVEIADWSTRALGRLLHEHKKLMRSVQAQAS